MDPRQPEDTIDLREYLAILRTRRWTILIVATVVIGGALAFSLSQTPLYTAKAKVLVQPTAARSLSPTVPTVNLDTEAEVAASEPVAALVIDDLQLDQTMESLLSDLSIHGIIETEVLEISFTSADPTFSRDAANSFAESYIEFRTNQARESVSADQDAIQNQLDAASEQLTQVTEELEAAREAEDDALIATLETSRNVLIARLGVLQQRLDDLQTNQASETSGGQVLEEASLPQNPSSPKHLTNATLAAVLGLTLGVGAAFLKERLDDRFRGRTDVEKVLGAPVLATIPKFRARKKEKYPDLVTLWQPNGSASESYRTLRTNLQFLSNQQGIKSLLVTSPTAGEGKTISTSNLAVVLAQAGSRVIVVSSDLRRPTIERYLLDEDQRDEGLSTWLSSPEERPIWDYIRDPGIPNLRILPSGPIPPNPAELLSSPRLVELVGLLENQADLVLFDSAPVLAVADATLLATHVGGTVIVINASTTHRTPGRQAKEEIERVGGNIIGTVLNSLDPTSSPYYYYGPYRYEYKATEQATENGKEKRRIRGIARKGLMRRGSNK